MAKQTELFGSGQAPHFATMNHPGYEVITIGAGAAGLAAAAALADAGRRVLVLEARDRVGGRIWTRQEPGVVAPIELGAEFIHGFAPLTVAWLRKAGQAPNESPHSHWRLQEGELRRRDGLFQQIQQAMRRNATRATHELSLDEFLKAELKNELSSEACEYVRMMAEGFDAADTRRISSRSIVEEWTGEALTDAPQLRPSGGYASILTALCGALPPDRVRVQLQSVVHEVRWQPGAVEVLGERLGLPFALKARCAVVALPLAVLQRPDGSAGAVRFSPPLTDKQQALNRLVLGPVIKVILKFRSAFWDELQNGKYQDASFLHAPRATFPTFWTALPLRERLLVGWTGGPGAAKLSAASTQNIVTEALRSLNFMFGGQIDVASELDAAYFHNWQRDPFAGGAYSYLAVGGGNAREALAAALEKTLFFAGEATDATGEAATVTGALLSGERAAREIIESVT